jgi:hypothetical protein
MLAWLTYCFGSGLAFYAGIFCVIISIATVRDLSGRPQYVAEHYPALPELA